MRRFVDFIDWAARLHFIGTAVWAGGGWVVTFFAASAGGWDPVAVWLASLSAGACCALMFIAFKVHKYPAFPQPQGASSPVRAPSLQDGPIPQSSPRTIKPSVKIGFGSGRLFETVARSGANLSRTVRVKIQNDTDDEISNGTMSVVNLEPPNRGHKDFFLKGDIRIGPRKYSFIDVAAFWKRRRLTSAKCCPHRAHMLQNPAVESVGFGV
jgi:hypothetical protein